MQLNGSIHITCAILKLVAASVAEIELSALFLDAHLLDATLHIRSKSFTTLYSSAYKEHDIVSLLTITIKHRWARVVEM